MLVFKTNAFFIFKFNKQVNRIRSFLDFTKCICWVNWYWVKKHQHSFYYIILIQDK